MNVEVDLNNAVAGPSTITQDSNFVFLPPPAAHPPPRTSLASTQDLLGRFNLHSAYDKHVRPSIPPQTPLSHASIPPLTPAALLPDSDDKMKKNSYRFLIKSVPGKHSMKKDDYLTTMMLVPPKQRIPIVEFDERTQREAFTVSAEGLKGWNASTLVVESAQAKEDRRKRKELKKTRTCSSSRSCAGSRTRRTRYTSSATSGTIKSNSTIRTTAASSITSATHSFKASCSYCINTAPYGINSDDYTDKRCTAFSCAEQCRVATDRYIRSWRPARQEA